ncbi:MAG: hypothetical protein Q8J78_14620, partial [Moraxellaceae bacterium]|nr:hypothetical protein [Moraxellaceae bacterium]
RPAGGASLSLLGKESKQRKPTPAEGSRIMTAVPVAEATWACSRLRCFRNGRLTIGFCVLNKTLRRRYVATASDD